MLARGGDDDGGDEVIESGGDDIGVIVKEGSVFTIGGVECLFLRGDESDELVFVVMMEFMFS